jgi:hypothetical protein
MACLNRHCHCKKEKDGRPGDDLSKVGVPEAVRELLTTVQARELQVMQRKAFLIVHSD